MDGVSDDQIDYAATLRGREAVSIDDRSKLARPELQWWQAFAFSNVIIEQLSVKPAGLGKFDHGVDRA